MTGDQGTYTNAINMYVGMAGESNVIHHCYLVSPKFKDTPRGTVYMFLSNKNKCFY